MGVCLQRLTQACVSSLPKAGARLARVPGDGFFDNNPGHPAGSTPDRALCHPSMRTRA